jgi:hypothetical protein
MQRDTKQSANEERPLSIRNGVWLSVLGVALLGIIALSLSREGPVEGPVEQNFNVASATQHSSFAKFKRSDKATASSQSSQQQADEIDSNDFSIVNDRSHWVDPPTRLFQVKAR